MIATPKKREVSKVSKKITSKRPVKTATVSESKIRNFASRSTKKTVRQTAVRSNITVATNVVPNKRVRKSLKMIDETINVTDDETVSFIPGQISLRLKERVVLYKAWLRHTAPPAVQIATQTFGYIFITFGLFFAYFFAFSNNPGNSKMLATISCSLSNCQNQLQTATSSLGTSSDLPQISFGTLASITSDKNTEFSVSVLRADGFNLYLKNLDTGKVIPLKPVNDSVEGPYNYLLPTKTMGSGEYKIYVDVISQTNKTKVEFRGPSFEINPPLKMAPTATNTNAVIEDTNLENEDTNVVNANDATLNDLLTETVEEFEVETKTSTTGMDIVVSPGIYYGQQRIYILSDKFFSKIELTAKLSNSKQVIYLGEAAQTNKGWLFWLDANYLPVGKYDILVQAYSSKTPVDSKTIEFINTISNDNLITDISSESQQGTGTPEEEVSSNISSSSLLLNSQISPLSLILHRDELATSSQGQVEARKILDNNSSLFNKLFARLATFSRAEDNLNLTNSTDFVIEEKISNILTEMIKDGSLKGSVGDVGLALNQEINNAKNRILSLRSIKEQGMDSNFLLDTDNDGIFDYDEINLYKTNPKSADSDNDGTTDGVEVSLGFDPINSSPEAIVTYFSPKKSINVNNDLIGISSIAPLLIYEEGQEKPNVQSEISGYALPNSFVTIYLQDEPNVLITKTKDDGTFSITFNHDLGDGNHEAYVALTDNFGRVVVRSNAYQFMITDTNFEKIDNQLLASALTTVDSGKPNNINSSIILALSVVSLGLILLLLAQTLKSEKIKPNAPSSK